jgi:uncharacterized protein YpmS
MFGKERKPKYIIVLVLVVIIAVVILIVVLKARNPTITLKTETSVYDLTPHATSEPEPLVGTTLTV